MSSIVSIPGPVWVQTATATVVNTVAETTLLAAGNGNLTLPANFLTVGKTLKFTAMGIHSASGNPTVRCQGFYEEDDVNASPFGMPTTAAVTINTTIAQTLNLTYQWSVAATSNTISCTNLTIEAIG